MSINWLRRFLFPYYYACGLIDRRISDAAPKDNTVDCETCGCMIRKEKAVRGASIVRRMYERYEPLMQALTREDRIMVGLDFREELYTPHYCKRCGKDLDDTGVIKFRRYDKPKTGGKKK
jgi:hypothetical protein